MGEDLVPQASGVKASLSAASYPPLQKTQERGTHGVVVSARSKLEQPNSGRVGHPPTHTCVVSTINTGHPPRPKMFQIALQVAGFVLMFIGVASLATLFCKAFKAKDKEIHGSSTLWGLAIICIPAGIAMFLVK